MNTSAGEGDRDDLAGWHRMSNARDQVAVGVGSCSAVATSAFPSTADIRQGDGYVRFVPEPEVVAVVEHSRQQLMDLGAARECACPP